MQMQIFRRAVLGLIALGLTLGTLAILSCGGSDDDNGGDTTAITRQANLTSANEVPAVPPSPGNGTAVLTLSGDGTHIDYVLTYSGLGTVTQAHIHAGSPTERGGIILYLCTNPSLGGGAAPAGAAGAQPCPQGTARVTGTLTDKDVVPAAAQGTTPAVRTFGEAVTQLLNNNTYSNVHTVADPGGEIRDQNLPPT